ncbi:hypothetical protein DPMN_088745 [Dreissena polymorpha]|uniref:Uncharacterized protein n=1 Tax=Dreissena polymorpha TaxID=45954 RepID=A0A9D4KVG9_DREPO|nr:hypothetical protein DPMN_088745 [Dreissena polymorpha]
MTCLVTIQPLTSQITGQLMTLPVNGKSVTGLVTSQLMTGPRSGHQSAYDRSSH